MPLNNTCCTLVKKTNLLAALALATVLGVTSIGCSSSSEHAEIKNLSQDDADRLNARGNEFDGLQKDPPVKAETRYAAGRLAESQNAPTQALEQYKEALKIDPKHENTLYRCAVVQTQLKQYTDAIATWNKYIEVTGGAPQAYANLGFCYELAGRPRDAEGTYMKSIQKEPTAAPCRVNFGLMLARMNRVNEAILQFGAVLSPAETHYNIASVYEQQGRRAEAKAEYAKALELDPKLRDARVRLAAMNKGTPPRVSTPPDASLPVDPPSTADNGANSASH